MTGHKQAQLATLHVPEEPAAERAILGAVLAAPEALSEAQGVIGSSDFYNQQHGMIFAAMARVAASGREPDLILTEQELRQAGEIERVGGVSYVAALAGELPDTENVRHYATLVRNARRRRTLQTLGLDLVRQTSDPGDHTDDILDDAGRRVAELSGDSGDDGSVELSEAISKELERTRAEVSGEPEPRIETGIPGLDTLLRGMRPGQLIVLAARTAVGKTALALQVALHGAITRRRSVVFVSLEMSRQELAQRALAQTAGLAFWRVRDGKLDGGRWAGEGGDWPTVEAARDRLNGAALQIIDRGCLTPDAIRARCRGRQLHRGLDLVVVDYLQLLRSGERHGGRTEEVGAISRGLKLLARDLGVPVLALSQLNREPEKRDDGRTPLDGGRAKGEPRLSDLRESGSIENDADAVILLHRRVEGADHEIRNATAILAKNRQGPTGRVPLLFEPRCFQFSEGKS